jgi:hypothetical protein
MQMHGYFLATPDHDRNTACYLSILLGFVVRYFDEHFSMYFLGLECGYPLTGALHQQASMALTVFTILHTISLTATNYDFLTKTSTAFEINFFLFSRNAISPDSD